MAASTGMRLVADHKASAAVSRWNKKMNDAAAYMIQQINTQQPRSWS